LAIAVDNLADAQSLTEIEEEKAEIKEKSRSLRDRSKSNSPEKKDEKVRVKFKSSFIFNAVNYD